MTPPTTPVAEKTLAARWVSAAGAGSADAERDDVINMANAIEAGRNDGLARENGRVDTFIARTP
jgi:hypothetical protein